MIDVTMRFPSPSSAKEAGKWLRFFTSGRYTQPSELELVFKVSRPFLLQLLLDNIGRHIPPKDWERTEVIIDDSSPGSPKP